MADTYWTAPRRVDDGAFGKAGELDPELLAFLVDLVRVVQDGGEWDEDQRAFVRFLEAYDRGLFRDAELTRRQNRDLALAVVASPPGWARRGARVDPGYVRAVAEREESASARRVPERLTEAELRAYAERARG
jgi:hypothetical protein